MKGKIILKLFSLPKTCDRLNVGFLIQSLIIFIGVLAFILSLNNFFTFFCKLKNNLSSNIHNEKETHTTLSKILFYNIFFNGMEDESINNKTIMSKEKMRNFYFNLDLNKEKILDLNTTNDNKIFTEFFDLLNPILFVSIFYLIRIILFKTKDTVLNLLLILVIILELIFLKFIHHSKSDGDKYFETIPIILYLLVYSILISKNFISAVNKKSNNRFNSKIIKMTIFLFYITSLLGALLLITFIALCSITDFNSKYSL